jgi:hypothetical protein
VATLEPPPISRRALAAQLVLVLLLATAAAVLALQAHARARDAEALALPVADLASESAELAWLAGLAAHRSVPRAIACGQASQLADRVERTRDELDRPVRAGLAPARAQALALAAKAAADAAVLARSPGDRAAKARLAAVADASEALQRALEAAAP